MNINDLEIQLESIKIDNYYKQGLLKMNNGLHVEAITLYSKAIDASKYVIVLDVYMARALCYMNLGCFEQAINDYLNPLFDVRNDNLNAKIQRFTNIGFSYYKLNDFEKAVFYYLKVQELDPLDSDALLMLSKLKKI
jgi:tetratricopeptide (TPR) repeat protein